MGRHGYGQLGLGDVDKGNRLARALESAWLSTGSSYVLYFREFQVREA
jgi:hypothetical protein